MDSSPAQFCSDSVLTGLGSPFNAAIAACHARIAHFTRAGYLWTPANTASLPTSPTTLPLVTISWTWPNIFSTSPLVLPFANSVSNDADALEMQQPEPTKLMSLIVPLSSARKSLSWSPQSGLWPWAEQVGCGISWKFRGFL